MSGDVTNVAEPGLSKREFACRKRRLSFDADMKTTCLLLTSVTFSLSAPSTFGQVSGRVLLRGTPPPEIAIQMTSACAQAQAVPPTTRHYVVGQDKGLANVFVVIRRGLERKEFATNTSTVTMECAACQIHPYVTAVQVGQPLAIRNDTTFSENVHFTGRKNRASNFALNPGGELKRTFDQPEEFIRIKGDAHPWFFGYLCVVEHPFFAVTDGDGNFRLPEGLPDGDYLFEARHLKAGPVTRELTVRGGKAAPLELALEVR